MTFQRPRFNPEINWGHILTATTFIVFGIAAFYSVKGDIAVLDVRVKAVETSIGQLTNVLDRLADKAVTDAKQDERIVGIERRVESNERRLDRMESRK